MSTDKETSFLTTQRKIGAGAGIVLAILLMILGVGLILSVILGAIAAAAVGYVLDQNGAQDAPAATVPAAPMAQAPVAAPAPEPAAPVAAEPEPAAPVAADPEPVAPMVADPVADTDMDMPVKPSAVLPGEQELAARKGTWRYQPA
ncbi:MAG: hypothetical protein OIF47_05320 [Marinibacterium sp.]|nr:hypothetical protein [Marinibacterium sp.]